MTATKAPQVPSNTKQATILQRSVCLTLRCGVLGNNRKVDLDALAKVIAASEKPERTLDEEQFHATMRLIDPKELRAVHRVQWRAKNYLRSIGIAAHRVFGEGTTLLPIARTLEAVQRLEEFETELKAENKTLRDRYLTAMAEQSVKLGPLFNPSLYKSPEEVETAHTLEWDFVSFASPEQLETVDYALAEASNRKYEQRLSSMFDEVSGILRGEALQIMTELEDRLSSGRDGKPKVLRGTALRDVQQFLANLPTRNLTGDSELPAALARITAQVEGLDVQSIRDSDALRQGLQKTVTEAKALLADMVATGCARGFSLGKMPD